jgi:CheY-like chemotaxis protein
VLAALGADHALRDIPVVLMTGDALLRLPPAAAVLVKPFPMEKLFEAINPFVRRARADSDP